MAATKIATCCYCGSRAALVLRGKTHHELSCSSCGAPLQALKMLPNGPDRVPAPAATPTRPAPARPKKTKPSHWGERRRKPKKRKGFGRKLWEEFWDEIEDIFD